MRGSGSQKLIRIPGLDLGSSQSPRADQPTEAPISFSFKHWRQVDDFGLDTTDPSWFASLLSSLESLTSITRSTLETNQGIRRRFRYHLVNWNAKNIPIQRSDLNWIPRDITENEEEFPFYQLSISTGNGRLAGFWGTDSEEAVFNIVLLDPEHNLQPSQNYNYRVDPCGIIHNEFCDLKRRADNLIDHVQAHCQECEAKGIAEDFRNHPQARALLSFTPSQYNEVMSIIRCGNCSHINSIDDMVTLALLKLVDTHNDH